MISAAIFHHALNAAHTAARDPHIPDHGVLLDFLPDNRLCVVGTNGQRITAITLILAHGASGRFFIPAADVERVLRSFPGGLREVRLSVYMLGSILILTDTQGTSMELQYVEGLENARYEDTLTAGEAPTGACYSVAYMLDVLRSCTVLTDGTVSVGFGKRQIVLTLGSGVSEVESIRCAVMPAAVEVGR